MLFRSILFVQSGTAGIYFNNAAGSVTNAVLTNGGNLLLGTTTDSSNGKLQLATHTTSAGGIGFGTDTTLYRSAQGVLAINDFNGVGTAQLGLQQSNVLKGLLASVGTDLYIDARDANGKIYFRTSGTTTALTLDSSQNATFAGQIFSGATHVTGQHTLADFGGTGINFDFTSGNIGRIASVKTSGSSTFELYTYNSGSAVKALDFSSAGNATFAGTVTPTGGIVGTTTNNNAAAGCVGEYVSSAIEYASRVSLTTSTPANVTSISLTAGD